MPVAPPTGFAVNNGPNLNAFWWNDQAGVDGFVLFRSEYQSNYSWSVPKSVAKTGTPGGGHTTTLFDVPLGTDLICAYTLCSFVGSPPVYSLPSLPIYTHGLGPYQPVTVKNVNPGGLRAAFAGANPGDQFVLAAGNYTEGNSADVNGPVRITHGGVAGAPVTIIGASRVNVPLIQGAWIVSAPYVFITRLEFDGANGTNYNNYPLQLYANHVTIDRCYIHDSPISGIYVGDEPPVLNIAECAIRQCHFYHNGTSSSYDHGIYIKTGTNHIIQGNLIDHNTGFGIQNYPCAQGLIVASNEIRQNGAGLLIEHDLGDPTPEVNLTMVDSNYFKSNTGRGVQVMYDGDETVCPSSGLSNTVQNNWAQGNSSQYGDDGVLGQSNFTHCTSWTNNHYADPYGSTTSTGTQNANATPFAVASTVGFPPVGGFLLGLTPPQFIAYTSIDATHFIGCTGGDASAVAAGTTITPSLVSTAMVGPNAT